MKYIGKTDIGKKRSENQDCFYCNELDNGMTLLTICDGMGGEKGGATASKVAIENYINECKNSIKSNLSDNEIRNLFFSAVAFANNKVYSLSKENENLSGMGTTLVSILIPNENDNIFVINVGDSRAYMINKDSCTQLSHDHSYVQYLVDMGELSPEKAEKHPDRNLITKAVGTDEICKPDVDKYQIERCENSGTFLLLCSDGLTDLVKDNDICKIVVSDSTIEEKADKLIALANKKGGNDNITVILAEV